MISLGGLPPTRPLEGASDRDSLEQTRSPIDELADEVLRRLHAPWSSPKLAA